MADDLDDLRRLAPEVDAPAAAAAFRRRRRRSRSARRGALGTAVVAILAAGTIGVLAAGDDDDASVIAGPGGTGGPVTFEVLSVAEATEEMGTLRAATDEDGYADLWERSGSGDGRPEIDFGEQVVVSITIPDDACPPELTAFERAGDEITPVFVETAEACEEPLIPKTYVAALGWGPLGDAFTLHLPEAEYESYGYGEQRLRVERGIERVALPTVWAQEPTPSQEGMGAIVSGTVAYDQEHGCFRFAEGDQYPIVWPAGTVGTTDGPGVVLPDGQIASVGDEVAGGGGYLDVGEVFGIPPECLPDTGEVAVFNPNGEVTVNAREGVPSAEPTCGEIEAFADRLRNVGIDYDYQPSASPEALFDDADLVLTGTVTGGIDARDVEAGDDRPPGSFVGYEIDVDAVFKSPAAYRPADELYVWLEHGLPAVEAEEFEDLLDPGLRVVVLAFEDDSGPWFVAGIEGFATACPGGPPIGRVGVAGTWADLATLDDLVSHLEQAAAEG